MKKHVKSLTYKPKIDAVRSGECTQTIRTGRNVSVGDEILFHGWEGVPRHSAWSWRMRVVVTVVYDIEVEKDGLGFSDSDGMYEWTSLFCDLIAAEDFIDPPTGEALRDVLFKLNGIPKEPVPAQIIRWGV